MKSKNIRKALELVVAGEVTTAEQDEAAFPKLDSMNSSGIYVGRFSGGSPWELHPDSDELLHILEGQVEIILLTDDEPLSETVDAGNIFVVPGGIWHRQLAKPSVTLLSVTPDNSEISFDEDPRKK